MFELPDNSNQPLKANQQNEILSGDGRKPTIIKGTEPITIDKNPTKSKIKQEEYERSDSRQSINDLFRKGVTDMKDVILHNPVGTSSSNDKLIVENPATESTQGAIFDRNFLTLRILFVDMLIVFCNLASDVTQGLTIIIKDGLLDYGSIACMIIWFPGIPAAIHFLAVLRHELVWYRVVLYAALLIVFYPVVPILALIIVLWMKPKDNKTTKEFMDAQYGATVAYVIQGCIASPIQLCYQSWLALTGILPFKWTNLIIDHLDSSNNPTPITFPASGFCIFFSILT